MHCNTFGVFSNKTKLCFDEKKKSLKSVTHITNYITFYFVGVTFTYLRKIFSAAVLITRYDAHNNLLLN